MPRIISKNVRKDAPMATITKPYVDDRTLLVEKVKEELGKKAEGMHFFYGDANIAKTGRYKDDGYVETGKDHRGDPLLMRPLEMHNKHLAEAADVSISNATEAKTGRGAKYQTRLENGQVLGPQETEN